jgi:GDPmannose 4,6-dehydratase
MTKRALITGITGQDGSYLAELLVEKGYQVAGLVRSPTSLGALAHVDRRVLAEIRLEVGDMCSTQDLRNAISVAAPDEVYNLAAQSHVGESFERAAYTANVNHIGAVRLLHVVSEYGSLDRRARVYQASTSELFGNAPPPQNEETPMHPRSPYACAKLGAFHAVRNMRERDRRDRGLFAVNGILFNHESPRRPERFVTRKITKAVARIAGGDRAPLHLGNLDAKRDWGHARDYVRAMWLMLQQDEPDDFVIATGESHSVQEFVEEAFAHAGLDWREFVRTSDMLRRPTEVDALCGDASKAERVLGWFPTVRFKRLVDEMVDADIRALR